MAMARSKDFKTPLGRLAFSQSLFKPRSVTSGGPKRYGCTLIFEEKHRAFFSNIIAEVIKEQWSDKGIARAKAGGIRIPLLKGDGKEAHSKQSGELHPGFGPGLFFIRTQANEERPPIVRWRDPNTPATQEEVYSGCYGAGVLNAFAWNHPQNGDGVSFGIRMFQKIKEGESIGGIAPIDANDWFEPVEDTGDLPAEMAGGAQGLFGADGLFG